MASENGTAIAIFAVFVIVMLVIAMFRASRDNSITGRGLQGSARFSAALPKYGDRPPIVLGVTCNQKPFATYDPSHDGPYSDILVADDSHVPSGGLLEYTGEAHLLTVGSTRSGKGVGAIIPNLMRYSGSVIVIDPKGENARATMEVRRAMGQKVVLVDPWKIVGARSDGYNPLMFGALDRQLAVEDARLIADALVVEQPQQAFWENEARSLISTILLMIMTDHQTHEKPWDTVRSVIGDSQQGLTQFLNSRANQLDVCARGAAQFLDKAPNEKSGVLSTVRQQTAFLDATAIRASLNASDFKFSDTQESPTTVYLVIPIDRLQEFDRWMRLLVSMALAELTRQKSGRKLPLLFILDEFAALKHLKAFDTAFGMVAGFGLQLWPIIQDFSQMRALYGQAWETFVANAGVLQYFGTRDLLTAEYVSRRIGPTTVVLPEVSVSTQDDVSSQRLAQRPLLFPDEVLRLDLARGIVFVENASPIVFEKLKYFDPVHKALLSSGAATGGGRIG